MQAVANQIPVSFTPAPQFTTADVVRAKIARSGWQGRYTEAIQYLREELKAGGWAPIRADEFAETFKITTSFLHLCVAIKAVECTAKKKGQGKCYKALPKLATLTAEELRNFRLSDFPNPEYVVPEHLQNKTAEQKQDFVNAMNSYSPSEASQTITLLEKDVVQELINLGELAAQTPTYLVGTISDDLVFEAGVVEGHQFSSRENAEQFMVNFPAKPGRKIAIVQVIEVYESKLTLLPTTR